MGAVQNEGLVCASLQRFSSDSVVRLPSAFPPGDGGSHLESSSIAVGEHPVGSAVPASVCSWLLGSGLTRREPLEWPVTSSGPCALTLLSCLPQAPLHTPLLLLSEYEGSYNPLHWRVYL